MTTLLAILATLYIASLLAALAKSLKRIADVLEDGRKIGGAHNVQDLRRELSSQRKNEPPKWSHIHREGE